MTVQIINADCRDALRLLPAGSVQTCVTSPPYFGLRDYKVDGQMGLEPTPDEFVAALVEVFSEVWRVLRDDGTLWLNLGDSFAGSGKGYGGEDHGKLGPHANAFLPKPIGPPNGCKPKDLIGIPWMAAFALRNNGWYLRSDIIWSKPNVMPESVRDRPTRAHEYIFLLSKSQRYYYDAVAIKEPSVSDHPSGNGFKRDARLSYGGRGQDEQWTPTPTRNKRTVWTVNTKPYKGAHFATFPADLIEPCILAGCPIGGTVLDPFAGSGTTLMVAQKHGRNAIGIELNPEYIPLIEQRLSADMPTKTKKQKSAIEQLTLPIEEDAVA